MLVVEVSKFPEVGRKRTSIVTVPAELGAGKVHEPVVEEIDTPVQDGRLFPPIVKSTDPGDDVVTSKTGLAPMGVEVPPP